MQLAMTVLFVVVVVTVGLALIGLAIDRSYQQEEGNRH